MKVSKILYNLFFLVLVCAGLASPADAGLVILGSGPGGAGGGQIAVNPNTNRVYNGGGYAAFPVTVFDVSNPAAPVIVTTVNGSGVTVNPNTNQYFTSTGFGGTIQTYDGATDTVVQTSPNIGFCGGQFDIDTVNNRVYMVSQCGFGNDPLHVYDPGTNSILAGPLGSGGIVGNLSFNSANGYVYVLSSFGTRTFDGFPGYNVVWNKPGQGVQGVNPVTNEVFVANGTNLDVLDGTSGALITTLVNMNGMVKTNSSLNRVYIADSGNQVIHVVDGATYALIEDFSLGVGVSTGSIGIDETTNRLYARASDGLMYVLLDAPPPSLAIFPASGKMVTTANFDLVLIAEGGTATIVSATLDAADVTGPLSGCVVPGTLIPPSPTGSTLSCSVTGATVGAGTHTFTVTVDVNGTPVTSSATWDVFDATQP